ncbi:hypothetical protein WBG78_16310 [Chryseolinea sp. T2]|uniref:hypothetical protein n=1 Tax=Chryseolinea sp. T2 TaxID=3129255 RepID=UPI003076D532
MRRRSTLLWLSGATLIGVAIVYLEILPVFIPPLLFGLGLVSSNDGYMKYRLSHIVIPTTFGVVFLWGTLPFFWLGLLLELGPFGTTLTSCIGCFLMTCLTVRLTLRELYFGPGHLALLVTMAFITVYLHALLTGQSSSTYEGALMEPFALTILLYQLSMTVTFMAMMTPIGPRFGRWRKQNS